MSEEQKDKNKLEPHVIRMADFSDPKPFKTTQGVFHSYTYLPFLGWLPPVELNIVLFLLMIGLAVALPQPGWGRKAAGFVLAILGLLAALALLFGMVYVGMLVYQLYIRRFGAARTARRLKHPDPEVRRMAALDLWSWGEPAKAAVPALIEALNDPDERVRDQAVQALGRIGPAALPAVPALTESLKTSETAWEVASALGAIGRSAAAAVPALAAALGHPSHLVRSAAAEALGKIGPGAGASVSALAAVLQDSDPHVRWRAAEALGEIGAAAATAVPALIRNLQDEESYWQAARTLGRIGGGSPEAAAALTALLQHRDAKHRAEAESALARLRPPA